MYIDRKLTYIQLIGIILALMASYYMEYFFNRTLLYASYNSGFTGDIATYDFGQSNFKPLKTFFDVSTVVLLFMGLGLSIHHFNLTITWIRMHFASKVFILDFNVWCLGTLSMALDPASCQSTILFSWTQL